MVAVALDEHAGAEEAVVAGDRAVGDGGRAGDIHAADRVARERAVADRQRAEIVDRAPLCAERSAGDRQARDRRRDPRVDLEDRAFVVAVDGQEAGPRPGRS